MPNQNNKLKEMKCDRCFFFRKPAVGYIELRWVTTRRFYVCEKHKKEEIAKNEEEKFNEPGFAPELTFKELSHV